MMSRVQPFCLLMGINPQQLSKKNLLFLEAELFVRICEELKEIIRKKTTNYFQIMRLNISEENTMLEFRFIQCIINDILLTNEYSLLGLALYTDTPEDVIHDLASGCNNNPTFVLSRKIIELHRSVRPMLYQEIINKIKLSWSMAA